MMMIGETMKKSVLATIAVVGAGAALAGGTFALADGGSPSEGASAASSRDDSYLAATSRELQGTGYAVDQVRRELVVDGHEVYALEGPNTRCILVAGTGQPAGKSESLGCQPSDESKALGSGFARQAGRGTVNVVWIGNSRTAVSARAGGKDLATQSGPTILAVNRPDPNAAGSVTWSSAGQARSFDLVSAAELDVRRRDAMASAAAPSP